MTATRRCRTTPEGQILGRQQGLFAAHGMAKLATNAWANCPADRLLPAKRSFQHIREFNDLHFGFLP
jgi:hypothetical protein